MKKRKHLNNLRNKLQEMKWKVQGLERSILYYGDHESYEERLEDFVEELKNHLSGEPEDSLEVSQFIQEELEAFTRKEQHAYVDKVKTQIECEIRLERLKEEQNQLVRLFLEAYLAQYQLTITDFQNDMVQTRLLNAADNLDELYIDWMVYLYRLTPKVDREYKLLTSASCTMDFLYGLFSEGRQLEREQQFDLKPYKPFAQTNQHTFPQSSPFTLPSDFNRLHALPYMRKELLEEETTAVSELIVQVFKLDFKLENDTPSLSEEDYRVLLKFLGVRWKMHHIVKVDGARKFEGG